MFLFKTTPPSFPVPALESNSWKSGLNSLCLLPPLPSCWVRFYLLSFEPAQICFCVPIPGIPPFISCFTYWNSLLLSSFLTPFSIPQTHQLKFESQNFSFCGSLLALNESWNSWTWPKRPCHCYFTGLASCNLFPNSPSTVTCSANNTFFSSSVLSLCCSFKNILAFVFAWLPNSSFSFACMSGFQVSSS